MSSSETIIITTPTLQAKHTTLSTIYSNLTTEPSITYSITKDSSTIKIFHTVSPDLKVLIRTYIVLVLPVQIDLTSLSSFTGNLTFHLDETILAVEKILLNLQSLQGHRQINGAGNVETLTRLAKSISQITGKYRTSETL